MSYTYTCFQNSCDYNLFLRSSFRRVATLVMPWWYIKLRARRHYVIKLCHSCTLFDRILREHAFLYMLLHIIIWCRSVQPLGYYFIWLRHGATRYTHVWHHWCQPPTQSVIMNCHCNFFNPWLLFLRQSLWEVSFSPRALLVCPLYVWESQYVYNA